jgi:hypothetical protein
MIDSIDAQLLTLILGEEYIGNTLGITDADLKIDDGDELLFVASQTSIK